MKWLDRLLNRPLPVMDIPETPFLNFWPGEIVRHMGRPQGDGFEAGCVEAAGRNYVTIKWATDLEHPERITDPAALVKILKQPMPDFARL